MADAKKADKPKAPQGGKAPQGAKQPKQGKGGGQQAAPAAPATRARVTGDVPPRLRDRFRTAVIPAMMKERGYTNPFQVPRLQKIVINMGVGEGKENAKVMDFAVADLQLISGQKPVVTRAKKSIANFKLRENSPIGCKVTLRGARMYEFLDRLVNLALPPARDLKGEVPGVIKARWSRADDDVDQRPGRRPADARPPREPRRARKGGHPVLQAQGADHRDPQGRGLHQELPPHRGQEAGDAARLPEVRPGQREGHTRPAPPVEARPPRLCDRGQTPEHPGRAACRRPVHLSRL